MLPKMFHHYFPFFSKAVAACWPLNQYPFPFSPFAYRILITFKQPSFSVWPWTSGRLTPVEGGD